MPHSPTEQQCHEEPGPAVGILQDAPSQDAVQDSTLRPGEMPVQDSKQDAQDVQDTMQDSAQSAALEDDEDDDDDDDEGDADLTAALPDEILLLVFRYLDNARLLQVRRVCRRWRGVALSRAAWWHREARVHCRGWPRNDEASASTSSMSSSSSSTTTTAAPPCRPVDVFRRSDATPVALRLAPCLGRLSVLGPWAVVEPMVRCAARHLELNSVRQEDVPAVIRLLRRQAEHAVPMRELAFDRLDLRAVDLAPFLVAVRECAPERLLLRLLHVPAAVSEMFPPSARGGGLREMTYLTANDFPSIRASARTGRAALLRFLLDAHADSLEAVRLSDPRQTPSSSGDDLYLYRDFYHPPLSVSAGWLSGCARLARLACGLLADMHRLLELERLEAVELTVRDEDWRPALPFLSQATRLRRVDVRCHHRSVESVAVRNAKRRMRFLQHIIAAHGHAVPLLQAQAVAGAGAGAVGQPFVPAEGDPDDDDDDDDVLSSAFRDTFMMLLEALPTGSASSLERLGVSTSNLVKPTLCWKRFARALGGFPKLREVRVDVARFKYAAKRPGAVSYTGRVDDETLKFLLMMEAAGWPLRTLTFARAFSPTHFDATLAKLLAGFTELEHLACPVLDDMASLAEAPSLTDVELAVGEGDWERVLPYLRGTDGGPLRRLRLRCDWPQPKGPAVSAPATFGEAAAGMLQALASSGSSPVEAITVTTTAHPLVLPAHWERLAAALAGLPNLRELAVVAAKGRMMAVAPPAAFLCAAAAAAQLQLLRLPLPTMRCPGDVAGESDAARARQQQQTSPLRFVEELGRATVAASGLRIVGLMAICVCPGDGVTAVPGRRMGQCRHWPRHAPLELADVLSGQPFNVRGRQVPDDDRAYASTVPGKWVRLGGGG